MTLIRITDSIILKVIFTLATLLTPILSFDGGQLSFTYLSVLLFKGAPR